MVLDFFLLLVLPSKIELWFVWVSMDISLIMQNYHHVPIFSHPFCIYSWFFTRKIISQFQKKAGTFNMRYLWMLSQFWKIHSTHDWLTFTNHWNSLLQYSSQGALSWGCNFWSRIHIPLLLNQSSNWIPFWFSKYEWCHNWP